MQRTCSTRGFAREESPKAAGWRLPGGPPVACGRRETQKTAGKQQERIEMMAIAASGKQVNVPDQAQKNKPNSRHQPLQRLVRKGVAPFFAAPSAVARRQVAANPGVPDRSVRRAADPSANRSAHSPHRPLQRRRRLQPSRATLPGSRRVTARTTACRRRTAAARRVSMPVRPAPGTGF
jgi:hypothetical protein